MSRVAARSIPYHYNFDTARELSTPFCLARNWPEIDTETHHGTIFKDGKLLIRKSKIAKACDWISDTTDSHSAGASNFKDVGTRYLPIGRFELT